MEGDDPQEVADYFESIRPAGQARFYRAVRGAMRLGFRALPAPGAPRGT